MAHIYLVYGLSKEITEKVDLFLKEKNNTNIIVPIFANSKNKNAKKKIEHALTEIINRKEFNIEQDNFPSKFSIIYLDKENDSTKKHLIDKCFLFANLIPCIFKETDAIENIIELIKNNIKKNDMLDLSDFLLLPARNFKIKTDDNKTLRSLYKEFSLTSIQKDDLKTIVKKYKQKVTSEDMPYLKTTKQLYIDERDLVFPKANQNEQHGRVTDKSCPVFFFESYYRFGKLQSIGFHYDVQFKKKRLGVTQFECSKEGHINANNQTHANIFLNDSIRLG